MSMPKIDLLNTTDAMIWAEEFCRLFEGQIVCIQEHGSMFVDPTLMVSWFANAMAAQEMSINEVSNAQDD